MATSTAEDFSSPMKRWPLVLFGAAVGVAGLASAQALLGDDEVVDTADELVSLTTAEVTSTDLLEEIEWTGTLDFTGRTSVTRTAGTVTAVVEPGTMIEQGEPLVEIDGEPVVLFLGETPFYRTMADDTEGPDVFELESNLVALGFDPDGTVTVDEDFTYYTELMVERWQEAIGLEITGTVDADAAVVVASPMVLLSGPDVGAQSNGELLELAPPSEMVVTVPVAVTDADEWNVGDQATVELADESTVEAVVIEIGTEVTTDAEGSTLEVTLEPVGDSSGLFEGEVTVTTVGEAILGATVVPTRALVALAEGGFAVEVVDGTGASKLIGVEIGAFDDGIVEIVAGDLTPGDAVVVPQ